MSFELASPECEILGLEFVLPGCAPFTLANAYFSSGVHSTSPLESLLARSAHNLLLAGDFNSHHVSWGLKTDSCGRRLWGWINDNGLFCHNSGAVTFLRGQCSSALDLTFSTSGVLVTSWRTIDSGTNSDHLPIIFDLHVSRSDAGLRQRRFVNYSRYESALRTSLLSMPPSDSQTRAESVVSCLNDAIQPAEFSVASCGAPSNSSWWDDACSRAYRCRKAAWKSFRHNLSPSNWLNYKYHAALLLRSSYIPAIRRCIS